MRRPRRRRRCEHNPWFARLREFVEQDSELRGEPPDLAEGELLAWADAYYARNGDWPNAESGSIPESPSETWFAVEAALSMGLRGMEGRSTLARIAENQYPSREAGALRPLLSRGPLGPLKNSQLFQPKN
jgi:hypothetical protein